MAAAGNSVTSFFHGNRLSVSADSISVLVATSSFASTEHIHVLNRKNYCRIPEIESPSWSLVIIIRERVRAWMSVRLRERKEITRWGVKTDCQITTVDKNNQVMLKHLRGRGSYARAET